MEDDHVDRTGVEAQQCVKLTVTNSSIGLIVLIAYAHQTRLMSYRSCPDAPMALRTARQTIGDGLPACMGAKRILQTGKRKTCSKKKESGECHPASQMLRFADLVVMAGRLHPFPFRTRP